MSEEYNTEASNRIKDLECQFKEAREVILMKQYIINTFLIHIDEMNDGDDPSVREKFLINNANTALVKAREFLSKHKERI